MRKCSRTGDLSLANQESLLRNTIKLAWGGSRQLCWAKNHATSFKQSLGILGNTECRNYLDTRVIFSEKKKNTLLKSFKRAMQLPLLKCSLLTSMTPRTTCAWHKMGLHTKSNVRRSVNIYFTFPALRL